jgi:segregation and condensation protein B
MEEADLKPAGEGISAEADNTHTAQDGREEVAVQAQDMETAPEPVAELPEESRAIEVGPVEECEAPAGEAAFQNAVEVAAEPVSEDPDVATGPVVESRDEAEQAGEGQGSAASALPEHDAAAPVQLEIDETQLKAVIEAIVYVAEEPATAAQIAKALDKPEDVVKRVLEGLVEEYAGAEHGVMIREVASGYKMATKAEHHEAVRAFAKSLKPPLKLSLAALETLAAIAYKQPITAPEIMEIRGVQGAGVLKTLLDRKLIQAGGRKNVVGRPILYRTTKDFLVQFGLKDLSELPTLKEFEELRRLSSGADEAPDENAEPPQTASAEPEESQAEKTAQQEGENV